jgi:hypothetical protein
VREPPSSRRQLAEELAGRRRVQHDLLAGLVLDRQLDPALNDDEHRVARLADAEQHLTRLDLTIDHRLREHRALVVIEWREQTDLGQERWVDRHAPRISRHVSMESHGGSWWVTRLRPSPQVTLRLDPPDAGMISERNGHQNGRKRVTTDRH